MYAIAVVSHDVAARYLVGVGRREAAGGHSLALPRLLRSRKIRCVAALPYSTLPIRSGGIFAIILAVSLTPSPKGDTGSQAPHHSGHAGL
jgi:hypothetical protein